MGCSAISIGKHNSAKTSRKQIYLHDFFKIKTSQHQQYNKNKKHTETKFFGPESTKKNINN